jgi:4'-phosphopantetheinyl transferase
MIYPGVSFRGVLASNSIVKTPADHAGAELAQYRPCLIDSADCVTERRIRNRSDERDIYSHVRARSLQLIRPHLQVDPPGLRSISVEAQRDVVIASDRPERFIQERENVDRGRVPTKFLGQAEVHLWVVPLILSAENSSYFKSILSLDEQERAGRFRKIGAAQRYIAARGSLRSLLGAYLTIEPDRLQFAYDAFGKPHLAGEEPLGSMRFSVSHSEDLALFGFARGHEMGVDVERIRPDIDFEDLAARYFSPNELKKLRALPADQQREAFYCGWTRKEAYLKGHGEGLSFPLDRVEVSLTPGEPAMILKAFGDRGVSRRWIVQHLSPAPGYIGAAAVEGRDITFRCFECEPGFWRGGQRVCE